MRETWRRWSKQSIYILVQRPAIGYEHWQLFVRMSNVKHVDMICTFHVNNLPKHASTFTVNHAPCVSKSSSRLSCRASDRWLLAVPCRAPHVQPSATVVSSNHPSIEASVMLKNVFEQSVLVSLQYTCRLPSTSGAAK